MAICLAVSFLVTKSSVYGIAVLKASKPLTNPTDLKQQRLETARGKKIQKMNST